MLLALFLVDDFASNIEKTLASILKKDRLQNNEEDGDSDKPGKKRKKKDKDKRKVRTECCRCFEKLVEMCMMFKNMIAIRQTSFEQSFNLFTHF